MCCRAQAQLQARLDKEHTRERDALLKELERAHQQHREAMQQAQQGTAWCSALVWWKSLQHSKPGSTLLLAFDVQRHQLLCCHWCQKVPSR